MSTDGGTGAPGTGNGTGSGTDNGHGGGPNTGQSGGQSAGASGGAGAANGGADLGASGHGAGQGTGHQSGQSTGQSGGRSGAQQTSGAGEFDQDAWAALAAEFGSPDKVRQALGHARTWEQRAKENHGRAQQAQTYEQQLADMQRQLTERDERDVQRAGKTALAQLKAELGQGGVKWDDVPEPLRPEPVRLLKDGEPDETAISAYATALTKNAGRPAPDPDLGKRGSGGPAPKDMNQMFRDAVRSRRG